MTTIKTHQRKALCSTAIILFTLKVSYTDQKLNYLAQQIKQHHRKLLLDSSFHLNDLTQFSYSFTDSRDRTTISIKHTALQS